MFMLKSLAWDSIYAIQRAFQYKCSITSLFEIYLQTSKWQKTCLNYCQTPQRRFQSTNDLLCFQKESYKLYIKFILQFQHVHDSEFKSKRSATTFFTLEKGEAHLSVFCTAKRIVLLHHDRLLVFIVEKNRWKTPRALQVKLFEKPVTRTTFQKRFRALCFHALASIGSGLIKKGVSVQCKNSEQDLT